MIKKIKLINYANKRLIARFETRLAGGDKDNGRRVKHVVFESPRTHGCYFHYYFFLTEELQPCDTHNIAVSKRLFFGKVRLCVRRDIFQKDTWHAISESIKALENNKKFLNTKND